MERFGRERLARVGLALLRVLTGLVFVNSGFAKVANIAGTTADFARWHVPLPDLAAPMVGGVELACGALLIAGIGTRWAALPLLGVTVGAVATAGLTDGGAHLVLPPVLGLLCAVFATRGGGACQLLQVPRSGMHRGAA